MTMTLTISISTIEPDDRAVFALGAGSQENLDSDSICQSLPPPTL
jgi:hypothetical protein